MSWITDIKNLGPWDFNKAASVNGYVNNPRWINPVTNQALATSPIWNPDQRRVPVIPNSKHTPCGYWTSSPGGGGGGGGVGPYVPPDLYVLGWNTVDMGVTGITSFDSYISSMVMGYTGIDPGSLLVLQAFGNAMLGFEAFYKANQWKCLSGRNWHILGVKYNGSLWGFGLNSNGQLGLGHTTDTASMTQIGTDTDWEYCSCGDIDSFAIKTDGSLWATGDNTDGHLGLGDSVQRTSFAKVGDGFLKAVSFGYQVTNAIKTDGTLWEASSTYPTLTQIDSGPWRAIVSASPGSPLSGIDKLLIKSDDTLWSWGINNYAQLGQGDTSYHLGAIEQVGSYHDWEDVVGGNTFGLATRGSTYLYGFGGYTNIHGDDPIFHVPLIDQLAPKYFMSGPTGRIYEPLLSLFLSFGSSGILDMMLLTKV